MHRKNLLEQLAQYRSSFLISQEETAHYKNFIDFVSRSPGCFERSHKGHVTGAAWVVNHDFSKALLTHHKKLNLWVQLGGHADGDPDIKRVALKEAHEESGIEDVSFVLQGIYDIDIHTYTAPCETHYDVRFLLQAPLGAQFQVSEESHNLAWVDMDKIIHYSKERTVLRLAEKIALLKSQSLEFIQPPHYL